MELVLRELLPDEQGFLYSTWLKSYKSSKDVGPLPNNLYWPVLSQTIKQILETPGTKVVVACNSEDPNQLFGYICSSWGAPEAVVHYLYVKPTFRKNGIGKALLEHVVKGTTYRYTFRTRDARYLGSRGTYDPRPVRAKPGESDVAGPSPRA